MGGFAVITNPNDARKAATMLKTMQHRGSYLEGRYQEPSIVLAQNYLRADIGIGSENLEPSNIIVPLRDEETAQIRICYDGQVGNWPVLAAPLGVTPGPFVDERLLMALYRKYGKEMCAHLGDAVFAFFIADDSGFIAARDLLGIKTLFYGQQNGSLYLASELKALTPHCPDVREFPPGHYMDASGILKPFARLPEDPPVRKAPNPAEAAARIREIIERSFHNRVRWERPTASLLSGGIDSSVIAWLANREYRKQFGAGAKLPTFALGVGESRDIRNARIMAEHLDSDHHELTVELKDILEVLPQVIYHLESFDPSLVRSAASNFLISRHAAENGFEVLLSGEGGDEVFCGYIYLKQFPAEQLFAKQKECIGFLHNNASLRLDRMNLCHSIRVVAPLISGELLDYAFTLPPEYKQRPEGDNKIEKWIFRKAFEKDLPDTIVWRLKQEFSQGSGSADVLPAYFEKRITDADLAAAQKRYTVIRTKEELYYFNIFKEHFGDGPAVDTVGQWHSF